MSNKEILKKAIEKANKNGEFQLDLKHFAHSGNYCEYLIIFSHDFAKAIWGKNHICRWCGKSELETKLSDYETGEKVTVCGGCGAEAMDYNEFPEEGNMMRKWQYHLQQMVLEEDPIRYLSGFLD